VYARPITKEEREDMEEIKAKANKGKVEFYDYNYIPITKSIYELRENIYIKPTYFRDNESNFHYFDYKDSIKYQKITAYYYDRHWTEFILFTKGSSKSEKFIECKKDRFKENKLLQIALDNPNIIGLKNDIVFTGYHTFRTIKEDINNAD